MEALYFCLSIVCNKFRLYLESNHLEQYDLDRFAIQSYLEIIGRGEI